MACTTQSAFLQLCHQRMCQQYKHIGHSVNQYRLMQTRITVCNDALITCDYSYGVGGNSRVLECHMFNVNNDSIKDS